MWRPSTARCYNICLCCHFLATRNLLSLLCFAGPAWTVGYTPWHLVRSLRKTHKRGWNHDRVWAEGSTSEPSEYVWEPEVKVLSHQSTVDLKASNQCENYKTNKDDAAYENVLLGDTKFLQELITVKSAGYPLDLMRETLMLMCIWCSKHHNGFNVYTTTEDEDECVVLSCSGELSPQNFIFGVFVYLLSLYVCKRRTPVLIFLHVLPPPASALSKQSTASSF